MKQKLSSALLGLLLIGSMSGCGDENKTSENTTSKPIAMKVELNPAFLNWKKNPDNRLKKSDGSQTYTTGYMPPVYKSTVHKPSTKQTKILNGLSTNSKFDLRDDNLDGDFNDTHLTPVKDQGQCGACWAFATIGALESNIKIEENLSQDFSENHLKHNHGLVVKPCDGGNMSIATAYFAKARGPVNDADDPYEDNSTSSNINAPRMRYIENIIKLPVRADINDNTYLKEALVNHGALYVDIHIYEHAYTVTADRNYSVYNVSRVQSDHAVLLVGWDDNYQAQGQTGAFILKNSWGTAWGDNGYFYVPYSDGSLAFGEVAYFNDIPDSEATTFDIVHDRAPNGAVQAIAYNNNANIYGLSVYPFDKNQTIKAVGIDNIGGDDTNITVTIYKNVSFTNGLVVSEPTTSETFSHLPKGWNTLQLQVPVDLNTSRNKFAVQVVVSENGGNSSLLPLDGNQTFSDGTIYSILNPEVNQSFYGNDGVNWTDLYSGNYSLAIKTFAQSKLSIDNNQSDANATSEALLALIWNNITVFIDANLTAEQYNSIIGVSGAVVENEQAYQDYINAHPELFNLSTLAQDVQIMIDTVNAGGGATPPTFNYVPNGILSPNGGEVWNIDENQTIRWDNTFIFGSDVSLYMLKEANISTITDFNLSSLLSSMNWSLVDGNASNYISDYNLSIKDLNYTGASRILVVSNQTGDWDISDGGFIISDGNTTTDNNQSDANATSTALLALIWENLATGIDANLTAEQYNSIVGVSGAVVEKEQTYQEYIRTNASNFTLPTLAQDIQVMINTVNGGWTLAPTFTHLPNGLWTPNGGEVWQYDVNETITWDNALIMDGNLSIYALHSDLNILDLNESNLSIVMNNQWYNITNSVPAIDGKIRVNPRDLNIIGDTVLLIVSTQTGQWDMSDAPFSINDVNNSVENNTSNPTENNTSCGELLTIADDSGFVDNQIQNDFAWSVIGNGVGDIEDAFNGARALDPTVNVDLLLPTQAVWDGMDIQAKALYILNKERYDRGIKPFEGISPDVVVVASDYAELLYGTSTFSHTEDGSPWDRLDSVAEINASKDFLNVAENLFVAGGSDYTQNPIAQAIYNWIYNDSSSSWGHRNFCLVTGLNDNSGIAGVEGLIGIGIETGENYNYTGFSGFKSTIVVMNAFDPSSTWNTNSTVSGYLCDDNSTNTDGNTTNSENNTSNTDSNTTNSENNTSNTDSNTTNSENNTTNTDGNTTNSENNTTNTDGNTGEENNFYGENASILQGTIILSSDMNLTPASACFDTTTHEPLGSCNAIFIDLFNRDNELLGSSIVQPDGNYTLYFEALEHGEPIDVNIKIHTQINGVEEKFYRDFGTDNAIGGTDTNQDSFKSEKDLRWHEDSATGKWIPDVNFLMIVQQITTLDLDLLNKDSDKFILAGTVQVPSDFIPGDIRDEEGEWKGWNMLSLTAINTSTGEYYWTEIGQTETSNGNHIYPFSFKLPNNSADYIIRLEKMTDNNGAFNWTEMYLNDEEGVPTSSSDHDLDGDEVLVSSMGITWKDNGTGAWTPDINKTGYFTISESITNVALDITNYGVNFKKITGQVTPVANFDLNNPNNHIYIEVIDAKTGYWLNNIIVNSDGNYSILLGDTILADGYILRTTLEHWDPDNWENSYWKSFYLDFTSNTSYEFKDESEVRWVESRDEATNNNYWIPNVQPLIITDTTVVDINFASYSAPASYTVSGTLSGLPATAKWINVHLYDPISYIGKSTELKADNSFEIKDLKVGRYIVQISYSDESENYRYFNYILVDDDGDFSSGTTLKEDMDVRWVPFDNNNVVIPESTTNSVGFDGTTIAYWAPEETSSQKTLLNLSADINLGDINIPQPVPPSNLLVSLTGAKANANVEFNLFVPNEPIGRFDNNSSLADGYVSIKFSDLKAKDNYQLQIWVDGVEYWYNGTTTLTSDHYDGAGFSIAQDETKELLNIQVPNDKSTITTTLALGNSYSNKDVDVYLWQNTSPYNFAWERFKADANGDINVTLSVKNGTDYIMEIYNPETWNGFVVESQNSLILAQSSWVEDVNGWHPKSTVLMNINSDLDLGTLNPPALRTVSFTVNNLAINLDANITEDVWILLEDTTSKAWYSGGNGDWSDWRNPTFSNTLNIKVPATNSTYQIYIYSSEHDSGFIDANGNSNGHDVITVTDASPDTATIDFSSAKVTWDSNNADNITIVDDTNISLILKSTTDYKSILGLVTLGVGDIEAGWICTDSTNNGKCGEVNADGTYSVNGLSPTNGDNYNVQYWANSGATFNLSVVWADASSDLTVDMDITAATLIDINGTVSDNDISSTPDEVVLLDVTESSSSWKVIDTQALTLSANDQAVNFAFSNLPQASSGHHYEVAVASKTMDSTTGVTSYVVQNATRTGTTSTNITASTDATISINVLNN